MKWNKVNNNKVIRYSTHSGRIRWMVEWQWKLHCLKILSLTEGPEHIFSFYQYALDYLIGLHIAIMSFIIDYDTWNIQFWNITFKFYRRVIFLTFGHEWKVCEHTQLKIEKFLYNLRYKKESSRFYMYELNNTEQSILT